MSDMANRIKARRDALGMTLEEVGKIVGVGKSTVRKWETGQIENMRRDKIAKLADALKVSPGYLMGWEDQEIPVASNILPMPSTDSKPMIGSIACGAPILAEQNIEGYVKVPDWVHCDFVLRCKGDSMTGARIYDGDIVCIRQQPQVENGEIAAVLVKDEATLKRVRVYEDHVVLEPENPDYRPLVFWDTDMENVRILGKATYFISAVR